MLYDVRYECNGYCKVMQQRVFMFFLFDMGVKVDDFVVQTRAGPEPHGLHDLMQAVAAGDAWHSHGLIEMGQLRGHKIRNV